MRKTLLSAMVATALAIPAVASANVTDAMIQTMPNPQATYCPGVLVQRVSVTAH